MKMTKSEHKATNPSSREMRVWNERNKEKYTKEEHSASCPPMKEKYMWNFSMRDEDQYLREELYTEDGHEHNS